MGGSSAPEPVAAPKQAASMSVVSARNEAKDTVEKRNKKKMTLDSTLLGSSVFGDKLG